MEEGEGGTEEVIQFSEGQLVEVRNDDERLGNSWFTAKIVKLPNRKTKTSVLVEYGDGIPLKRPRSVYVNESLVRPLPVEEPPNQFLLDQAVDAFHENAWRRGKITEVHDDSTYTICFFSSRTEKYMDFGHKDLRVHQDWIGGKWVRPHDQGIDTNLDQDEVRKKNIVKEGNFCDSSKTPVQSLRKNLAGQSPPLIRRSESLCHRFAWNWECSSMKMPGKLYCEKHQSSYDASLEKRRKGPKIRQESGVVGQTSTVVYQRTRQQSKAFVLEAFEKDPKCDSSKTPVYCLRKNLAGQSPPLIRKSESLCHRHAWNWQCSSMKMPGKEYCEKHQLSLERRRNGPRIRQESGVVGQTSTFVEPQTRQQSKAFVPEASEKGNLPDNQCASPHNTEIISGEVSRDYQELPKTLHLTKCSMNLEENTNMCVEFYKATEDGPNQTLMQTLLSDHNSDEVTVENDKLPFVKSQYRAWEIVESMEVFRSMPQYPHFRPLQQKNEFVREGEAIGYMISFATIAVDTRRSKLEDPKSSLENKLNALPELETMGFNVHPIRTQLCKLLSAKDDLVELDVMLKQIEGKMLQEKHDADLLQSEMDETDEKIEELEGSISQMKSKRRKLMMEKKTKDCNTLALHERICEVMKRINENKVNVAAAPW